MVKEHRGGKFVAVTFDDGYKSDWKLVVPILKKYNAKATFFVIGSLLNTRGYMTDEELKKLSDSGVAQIGNHTNRLHALTRNQLISLCNDNPDEILSDIEKNEQILEKITEKEVTAFSFPYGVYNEYLNNAVKGRGYISFSTEEKNVKKYSEDTIAEWIDQSKKY